MLTGVVKSVLFIGVAPLLAAYYGDPRVETITYIIALRPAIEGFENIGQVDFRRDLRFDKEFRYWVYRRLLTFLLTIGIVLWLRNYLALALAAPISGYCYGLSELCDVRVPAPFRDAPYRRDLEHSPNGGCFCTAMRYFGGRGEAFILGGLTTPQVIGAYTVGAELIWTSDSGCRGSHRARAHSELRKNTGESHPTLAGFSTQLCPSSPPSASRPA